MGRYRRILVAVDGSESSRNAFRQACKIATNDKTWLTVITTIPSYEDLFQMPSMQEKVTMTLRAEGERIVAEIKKIAAEEDTYIKTIIEEGTPFDTIIDTAEEGNYDLIVMGRQGMQRVEKALVGSVTARVIGNSQRDVLVIPLNTKIGWKNILLATDGSKYSISAADKAIDLAQSYGGEVKAVSVVDVTEEFETEAPEAVDRLIEGAKKVVEEIRKKAEARGVRIDPLVKEGDTYKVITGLAKKSASNIIVMGSHGRTGIKRLLMGSVTEKVLGYAPCPVLVVRG
ncbi:MAG TPA: universal stress protein [Candidatus Sulfobium mesophilum]|nr:universal stress protein [Candidatus Sulfobium mesophilum]